MRSVAAAILGTMCLATTLQAQTQMVPQEMNYQGRFTDGNGVPVTGTQTLKFRIYNEEVGGNLLWGPQTNANVVLSDQGEFNVVLGSKPGENGNPVTHIGDAFQKSRAFISVSIVGAGGSENELTPRQQILSAPYTLKAENGVPVGTIITFFGTAPTAPDGWLYCDGSEIPNEPKFAKLKDHLRHQLDIDTTIYVAGPPEVFKTPDLRGVFLRGMNDFDTSGEGKDPRSDAFKDPQNEPLSVDEGPARKLGSLQIDDFESHTHDLREGKTVDGDDTYIDSAEDTQSKFIENGVMLPKGGTETRPNNMAIAFLIKY